MTSKIINMADKLRDEQDLKLEALFRSEPVADDGFSARVMSRIRRRIWVRRLALPVAFAVGGGIALKPLLQLATAMPNLVDVVPAGLISLDHLPLDRLPQLSTLLFGAALLMAVMMASKILEE